MAEGKIGGTTFMDYTYADSALSFNFNRQYFSYGIDVSEKIKFKFVLDVGRTDKGTYSDVKDSVNTSEDTRLVAFLKKAQIDYTCSFGKTSLGLIGNNTLNVQEKNWGYRFLEKSALDKYGFSNTADLGVEFSNTVADLLHLSLQVVNGEGYIKPQENKYHKAAFNATFGDKNLTKKDGFNGGVVFTTEPSDSTTSTMTSFFGGFAGFGLRVGGEYDTFKKGDLTRELISASVNYEIIDKVDIFTRFDFIDNDSKMEPEGALYTLAGFVLNCGSGLSVAPNMRKTIYEGDAKKSETEYKVNFQFTF